MKTTPRPAAALFLVFTALWLACARAAADGGRSGIDFLTIVPSPRVVGMGEAGAAFANDHLSAFSVNPAGLGRLRYAEGSMVYNQWFEGIALQHVSYALPTQRFGALGVSGTLKQVKGLQGVDNNGVQTGNLSVQDSSVKLAYSTQLFGPKDDRHHGLLAGVGMNYVREKLGPVAASTVLYDFGLLYIRPIGTSLLALGASGSSLGAGLKFDAQRDPPPSVMRAGAAWTFLMLDDPLTVVWDMRKPLYDDLSFGAGLEYTVFRAVSWRLGYSSGLGLGNGLRFGMGVKFKVFGVDYALAPYGDFGMAHRLSLSMQFGAPVSKASPPGFRTHESSSWHTEKGNEKLQERRYYEAAIEFNEALRLDPLNKSALQGLRLVRELLEQRK